MKTPIQNILLFPASKSKLPKKNLLQHILKSRSHYGSILPDSSGNGNHALLINSNCLKFFGYVGGGSELDKSHRATQAIALADGSLEMGMEDCLFEFLINPIDKSQFHCVFSKGATSDSTPGYRIALKDNGAMQIHFGDGTNRAYLATTSQSFDEWTHWAISVKRNSKNGSNENIPGTGEIKIFKNGVEIKSDTTVLDAIENNCTDVAREFAVGDDSNLTNGFFYGSIASLRVSKFGNGGMPTNISSIVEESFNKLERIPQALIPYAVSWWVFSEGDGTKIWDVIGENALTMIDSTTLTKNVLQNIWQTQSEFHYNFHNGCSKYGGFIPARYGTNKDAFGRDLEFTPNTRFPLCETQINFNPNAVQSLIDVSSPTSFSFFDTFTDTSKKFAIEKWTHKAEFLSYSLAKDSSTINEYYQTLTINDSVNVENIFSFVPKSSLPTNQQKALGFTDTGLAFALDYDVINHPNGVFLVADYDRSFLVVNDLFGNYIAEFDLTNELQVLQGVAWDGTNFYVWGRLASDVNTTAIGQYSKTGVFNKHLLSVSNYGGTLEFNSDASYLLCKSYDGAKNEIQVLDVALDVIMQTCDVYHSSGEGFAIVPGTMVKDVSLLDTFDSYVQTDDVLHLVRFSKDAVPTYQTLKSYTGLSKFVESIEQSIDSNISAESEGLCVFSKNIDNVERRIIAGAYDHGYHGKELPNVVLLRNIDLSMEI